MAWLQKKPTAHLVRQFILDAEEGDLRLLMSILNVGEAFYILAKRRNMALAEEFLERLPSLPIHVVVPDESGVLAAKTRKSERPLQWFRKTGSR